MIITCPSCSTRYKLDPAQFGPEGRRVRCTNCSHVWTQMPADDLPKPVDPAPAEADGAQDVPGAGQAGGPVPDGTGGGNGGQAENSPFSGPMPNRDDDPPDGRPVARGGRPLPGAQSEKRGKAGWIVLVLVIGAGLVALGLARETVVRAWPPSARLFAAVGLAPAKPGEGLTIKVIDHRRVVENGTPSLVVKGEVTNTSSAVRDVPRLKASLRNAGGAELASWTFATAQARLLPGETAPFVTRLENPSTEAAALNIDFAPGGP